MASSWTPIDYNMLYDFLPDTVLLLLVVELFRKGRENPLVMRSWWAFLDASGTGIFVFFDGQDYDLMLELLGLPWRGGFNVDFAHYMATSTSLAPSTTLVCGTLGTTVSTASVFEDLVYYKAL